MRILQGLGWRLSNYCWFHSLLASRQQLDCINTFLFRHLLAGRQKEVKLIFSYPYGRNPIPDNRYAADVFYLLLFLFQ